MKIRVMLLVVSICPPYWIMRSDIIDIWSALWPKEGYVLWKIKTHNALEIFSNEICTLYRKMIKMGIDTKAHNSQYFQFIHQINQNRIDYNAIIWWRKYFCIKHTLCLSYNMAAVVDIKRFSVSAVECSA